MALIAPVSGEPLSADTLGTLVRLSQSNTLIPSAGAAASRGPGGTRVEVRAETTPGENRPKFSGDLEHDLIVGDPVSIQLQAEPFTYVWGAAERAPLPTGLSINTTTGLITGAAQAPGDTTAVVWARNSRGARTAELLLHATMPNLPVVYDQSAVGQVGELFSYQITRDDIGGVPRTFNSLPAYAISGLPEGLSLDPDTGLISGTPVASLSPVALNLSVRNASGLAWIADPGRLPLLTLTVRPPAAPRITSPDNVGAFLDQPLTHYFATNVDAWLWEVDAGTPLPPGLSLELSSDPWVLPAPPPMGQAPGMPDSVSPVFARLTGVPTDAGVYEVLIRAGGQGGWGPQQRLVISIGTVTPQIVAGDPPEWDLAAGRLELELEINASNPTITAWETRNASSELSIAELDPPVNHKRNLVGTILTAGTYSIEIRAANQFGWGEWLLITVIAFDSRAPVITHDGSESCEPLSTFSLPIVASNSPTAYGCELISGSVIVSTAGSTASITVRVKGTHVVRISATNAYGTAFKDVTFTANDDPSYSLTSTLSLNCGVTVSGTSIACSGIGPITDFQWSSAPSGLSINSSGAVGGKHNYDPSKTYPRAFNTQISVKIAGEWFTVGTTVITMNAATLTLTPVTANFNTVNPTYSAPSGGEVNFGSQNSYSTAINVDGASQATSPVWSVVKSGGPTGNTAYLTGSFVNPGEAAATLKIAAIAVNISWSGLPLGHDNDSPPNYTFTVTLTNNKGRGTCTVTCTHNDPRT